MVQDRGTTAGWSCLPPSLVVELERTAADRMRALLFCKNYFFLYLLIGVLIRALTLILANNYILIVRSFLELRKAVR
jgi:hypothetical protein